MRVRREGGEWKAGNLNATRFKIRGLSFVNSFLFGVGWVHNVLGVGGWICGEDEVGWDACEEYQSLTFLGRSSSLVCSKLISNLV